MARIAVTALAIGLVALSLHACGEEAETGSGEQRTTAAVPRPERYVATEVALTECRQGSGSDIRIAGLTCEEAAPITKDITTAFADRNLRKEVVERGNGWRCYQRLFDDDNFVEQVCWRGDRQVLIFNKG